jgi:hypothetical protein
MDNLIDIAGIIIGIGLISVLLGAFLTFDQLIRLEYNSYRAQWEDDGTPRGFFWVPREYWRIQSPSWFGRWKSQYKSSWSMQKANLFWLFSTPLWIKNDEKAKKLLKRMRVLVLIWNGSFLLGFILTMTIGMLR